MQHPSHNIQQQLADHEEGDRPSKTGKQQRSRLGGTALTYTQQQLQAGQGRGIQTVTAITNGQIDEICIYS